MKTTRFALLTIILITCSWIVTGQAQLICSGGIWGCLTATVSSGLVQITSPGVATSTITPDITSSGVLKFGSSGISTTGSDNIVFGNGTQGDTTAGVRLGQLGVGTTIPSAGQIATNAGVSVAGAAFTGAFNVSGTVYLAGLTSEGGTKSAICRDDATNQIEVNAAASCTVSTLAKKDWVEDLSCKEARRIVKGMRPAVFRDKDRVDGPRLGFAAEWTEDVDKRLVYYDRQGKPSGVDYERFDVALARVLQCGG